MPNHTPATILVVDDNTDVRVSTSLVLRLAGFEVWEAATGGEALRLVRDQPNLVILDVRLPDLSGFEVCRRIRADPATASILLLHLSGMANSSEDRTHGLEGGADGYLLKPVEPAELIAQVRALLRLGRAEQSLRESEERYRLIAENASAAVFMLDEESTILFANRTAEQLFGYPAGELLHRNLTMLMPQAQRGLHQAAFARYQVTGKRTIRWEGVAVTGLHQSGREICLEVSFGEFHDQAGRRRFVGVALDVSARKEAEQLLVALSRKLLQVQETERRHIAHELHDEVGQALTALKITLHTVHQITSDASSATLLQEALGMVDRIMQQARTLSLALRPPMMDDLGLIASLRWHVKVVTERAGLPVQLETDVFPGRLPAELEMACFRVVQEALNNVVKHARARRARVELRLREGKLHLSIRDDGAGFDAAVARKRGARGASLGLISMEERCLLLGGQFSIESASESGTEIRARFPLDLTVPATEPQGGTR